MKTNGKEKKAKEKKRKKGKGRKKKEKDSQREKGYHGSVYMDRLLQSSHGCMYRHLRRRRRRR